MVIKAPVPKLAKLNVNVVPETAPEMVEYSPANEQVEIVVVVLLVGMVAEPKELANVQPLEGNGQFIH